MPVIRRHPTTCGVLSLLLITMAIGWLFWPTPDPALADPPYEPLDAVTAARLDVLRGDAGLDDDVLSALNLTEGQLETALVSLRDWYDTNSSELIARWASLADQRACIRGLQSAINMGADQSAALASAREQLAQLLAQYQSLLSSARTAALDELGDAHRLLCERMRAQDALPMPFRVLALTDEQQQTLKAARTRYHQRLAVARESQQRATIRNAYQQEVGSIIGTGGLQTLAGLREYLGPASERVVAAVNLVMPVEG